MACWSHSLSVQTTPNVLCFLQGLSPRPIAASAREYGAAQPPWQIVMTRVVCQDAYASVGTVSTHGASEGA
eukprot:4816548-Amphidinium_carterae.1